MTSPSFNYCPVCEADWAYYTMHAECARKYLLTRHSKCPSLADALIAHIAHMDIEDEHTDTDEDIGEENN